jgi:hypothetical protein
LTGFEDAPAHPRQVSKMELENEDQNEEDAWGLPTKLEMDSTGSTRYIDIHGILILQRNVTLWSELALRL